MKKSDWKTNLVGFVILITILVAVFMLYEGKIKIEQFTAFLSVAIGLFSAIGFFLSKDAQTKNEIQDEKH